MDKHSFILAGIADQLFRLTAWNISLFSVVYEEEDAYLKDAYKYRLVRKADGYYFINNDDEKSPTLELIEGSDPSKPLFGFDEMCVIKPGDLECIREADTSTYGILLFNTVVVNWPFRGIIDYQNKLVDIEQFERMIIERLEDDPDAILPEGSIRYKVPEGVEPVYVRDTINYMDAVYSLAAYNMLCVPTASQEAWMTDPAIEVRKKELLELNKDRLHDPAVLATIIKELTDMDRAWIAKSPSAGFYIKDKNFDITRRKSYIMMGAELNEGGDMVLLPQSLKEGWPLDKLDVVANSLRAGTYNRSKDTALGGERVKYFFRIMQNTRISMHDCNTPITMPTHINIFNVNTYVGLYTQEPGGKPELITKERVKTLLGKVVPVRNPRFCKAPHTDFCEICMGLSVSQNPTSPPALSSDVGSRFMAAFMKAGHGKALSVAAFNPSLEIF